MWEGWVTVLKPVILMQAKSWIFPFYCKLVIKKERENCLQQFELSSLHKPAYKGKIKPTIQKAVDNFRSYVKPRLPDAEII